LCDHSISCRQRFSGDSAANDRERAGPFQPLEDVMNKRNIPRHATIEELASFWDSHSVTEFEDQLEEVTGVFAKPEQASITLRLKGRQAEALHRIAQSKGIDSAALVRRWLQERIRQETKAK
jgi:CopG antitoxin of type II toxin-antitoxin system